MREKSKKKVGRGRRGAQSRNVLGCKQRERGGLRRTVSIPYYAREKKEAEKQWESLKKKSQEYEKGNTRQGENQGGKTTLLRYARKGKSSPLSTSHQKDLKKGEKQSRESGG